ncbi:MAG: zinc-dependent metalloprotease [Fulvivirga sp.]|nr:zinc-dependent metalloprotease [Fulvivirga sp.]
MRIVSIFILIIFYAAALPANAQKKKNKKKEQTEEKKDKFKKYEQIVKKGTETDEGLFNVHINDEDYYYEIPFSMLNKDLLWVTRISKIPSGLGGGYVNSGSKMNEQIVHWSRVKDKIHLKSISYNEVAPDSLPIHISVRDNNYDPIIAAFSIEAFGKDSTSALIKVNDLFLKDIRAISGLPNRFREQYKVKGLDDDRSFISRISSYPENVEVRHDLTFSAGEPPSNSRTGTITMQLAQSMYLLPEKPMTPRLYDERVGWFTISQIDYGSDELKADRKRYIRRWRLEPKDPEAYARGELVEPKKPIVYYLDPATPKKWIPYFKQGVEDWQAAFEEAGFKNAIIAREAPSPEEDPDWSAEDARYSTVRYIATTTRNAMGPSVSDPRSGEIIESDIVWYHNHLRSYRNRYLLETGAANPAARTLDTPEAHIGEMMRMVIAHEIGHAIGLPHNMKASYSYPTDSLRSATFTNKWGLAASIMDYTRYNYVAQPGDVGVRWVRMLGPYDKYAVNWGYRYLEDIETAEQEKEILDQWIAEKEGDPRYLFGSGYRGFDPSSQTESVGDDPVKASTYGLSNLKIVAKSLPDWVNKDHKNYDDLEELYGELIGVWRRYAGHVITNIGGIYELPKTTEQAGFTYTHISKNEQQKSMEFLNQHVFTTPDWLLSEEIVRNIRPYGHIQNIKDLQVRLLSNLLNSDRLERMIENEAMNGNEAYTPVAMLDDLRKGLWAEIYNLEDVDVYRRNLQHAHAELLLDLIKKEEDEKELSDIAALARSELTKIQALANRTSSRYVDGMVKYHLMDIAQFIEKGLKGDD